MRRSGLGLLVWGTALAGAGCGGEDQGPGQSPLAIEKPATKSGDQQTGPVEVALGNPLRVLITRDGEPVEGVDVSWAAGQGGSLAQVAESGEDGIASAVWTLGPQLGNQVATAEIDGADGSPLTYTAVATEGTGPPPGPTINVLGPPGEPRFEPNNITVTAGQTVTWIWDAAAVSHNVVADDRNNPTTSGTPTDGPHTFSFTFNTVGAFRYYCQVHGGLAGVGMSGRVVVQAAQP
jgi:plastocyanin